MGATLSLWLWTRISNMAWKVKTSTGSRPAAAFSTEIAKRKIVMAFGDGNQTANLASSRTATREPTSTSRRRTSPPGSASRSRARKPQFAGNPDFQTQTRKFGLLYTIAGRDRSTSIGSSQLAKQGVPKLAAEVVYTQPADVSGAADVGRAGAGADPRREAEGRRRHVGDHDGQ